MLHDGPGFINVRLAGIIETAWASLGRAWKREGAKFTDARFSRGHRWTFDGGIEVHASASPHVVPLPLSVAAAVDPEEA